MSKSIKKLRATLLEGMERYLEQSDGCTYTQQHITRAIKAIDTYLAAIAAPRDQDRNEFILDEMKTIVEKLNKINESCLGGLIETDQREQICEIILTAARNAGLVSEVYDVTEQWRRW